MFTNFPKYNRPQEMVPNCDRNGVIIGKGSNQKFEIWSENSLCRLVFCTLFRQFAQRLLPEIWVLRLRVWVFFNLSWVFFCRIWVLIQLRVFLTKDEFFQELLHLQSMPRVQINTVKKKCHSLRVRKIYPAIIFLTVAGNLSFWKN